MASTKPIVNSVVTLSDIRDRCRTSGGCWIWRGALVRYKPYMSVHEDGVRYNRRVQKVVLNLLGKSVPDGARITQTCGNPLCCAPGHQHVPPPKDHSIFIQHVRGNPWGGLLWIAQ